MAAKITDVAGNISDSASLSFTLNTAPPQAAEILQADGKVTVDLNGPDGDAFEAFVIVPDNVSGGVFSRDASTNEWSFQGSGSLPTGVTLNAATGVLSVEASVIAHQAEVSVSLTDIAGNTATPTTLTVLTDPPVATIGQADGFVIADLPAEATTAELEYTPEDASEPVIVSLERDADGDWVVISNSLAQLPTDAEINGGEVKIPNSAIEHNTDVTVTVADELGNSSDADLTAITVSQAIVIDTTAPTLALDTISDTDLSASEASSFVVSGTSDAEEGQTVTVTFSDGTTDVTTTGTVTSGTWTASAADISGLDEGNITVSAAVSDVAGNESVSNQEEFTLDTTAPVISSAVVSEDGLSMVLTYSEALSAAPE